MTSSGFRWGPVCAGVGRWPVACLVVTAMAWAAPCAAQVGPTQIPENTPPESPIRLGPLYVSPLFEITDVGFDSNVFNDDREERDLTATVSAQVASVMLVGPMRVTGELTTDYVWFQKVRSERSVNNDVGLRLEGFFDRLHPWILGEFIRTRERAGFEIDSRALRRAPTVTAGMDWVVGSRTSLTVTGRFGRTEYADSERFSGANLAEQLNNDAQTYTAGVLFELTPLTALQVDGELGRARFTDERVRDNDSWAVLPRLLFQPDAMVSGELMVGYRTMTPTRRELRMFAGVVAQGDLTISLLDVTQFAIEVSRDTQYSYDELHPYYVQTGGGVSVTQQIGGSFEVKISAGRYELVYRDLPDPVKGPRGVEQLTTVGLGVGYRLGESITIGVQGQFQRRRSILRADRDYDRNVYYGSVSYLLR